jgi:hypothetical protein
MTNLNPRNITAGLVLAFSLFACGSLEAGVIVNTSLSLTQLQILPPGATPGSYSFTDFGGCCYQATLATISVTGTSTGEMQLTTNSTPDYSSVGGGDRLLLSLTNNTGVAFTGITLLLGGTAFDLEDGIDPSRGTFSSSTYTSDPAQRLPGANASINSPTNTNLIFTFESPLAAGATTYFYLPILDNGSLPNDQFDLSETPTVATSGVPEPAMFLPLGLALIGLAGLRRRFGN